MSEEESSQKGKSRGWLLTINNPTNLDVTDLIGNPDNPDYQYLVFQYEIGEKTRTYHLQGYIHYKNPRVCPKKKFPRAHIEHARSTRSCIEYCMKTDTRAPGEGQGPFEFGIRPIGDKEDSKQGERNDLRVFFDFVSEPTTTMLDIAVAEPSYYARYHKGIVALKNQLAPHRTEPPKVFWFYGPSGTGKSRRAMEIALEHEVPTYFIKDNSTWWDNYNQESTIIIDDFDKNAFSFRDLLTILDRYPLQKQVKGGYVKINSPVIIITCEFPPEELWDGNTLEQVTRRLTSITKFKRTDIPRNTPVRLEASYNADGTFDATPLLLAISKATSQTAPQDPQPSFAWLPGGKI